MNAAVRAIVRMGIYVGCKVYLIKEVGMVSCHFYVVAFEHTLSYNNVVVLCIGADF